VTSQSCELRVRLSADLHARPAGQVVQTLARFDSSVTVEFGELEVDGRGVLALMRLGATAGNEVTLRASGPEAEQALAAVGLLLGEACEAEARPSR
jgi:phosphotransferase system HPr (HPr) family protein